MNLAENSHKMNEVIEIKNLAVGYGDRTVLSDIEAHIGKGCFISILGPNGVGKTTLLRTLSRHLERLNGTILMNNRDISEYSQKELAKKLAVVLTTKLNTELFTGFEFAAMGRYPHTDFIGRLSDDDREHVMESLKLVNAGDLANRQMNQMSDGEKQKLYIARAICQDPEYIILDEPTSHLDLKHRLEVMSILRNSCREKNITIVASLHDIDLAARISDQVALVKEGRILDWGIPEEVLNEDNVRSLYDIDTVCYDRTLGSIEIRYWSDHVKGKKIFCVSGSSYGAVLFRSFLKSGFDVSSGTIHENEIDYHVATSLEMKVVGAKPYAMIDESSIKESEKLMLEADYVIDTGFIIGDLNRANTRLIGKALKSGKKLYTLRSRKEFESLNIENGSSNAIFFDSDHGLIKSICGAGK